MHLHEFLAELHSVVQPKCYLEVGVQHGTSLKLATTADVAIGIDPFPIYLGGNPRELVYAMESDNYFQIRKNRATMMNGVIEDRSSIDFGFVDGLHHYEQALRDFLNIEEYCHESSIIVMDDVLPRNWGEASRDMCPGDWAGDVWKAAEAIIQWRPELRTFLVNTQPTGTLLAFGFRYEPTTSREKLLKQADALYGPVENPPASIIQRSYSIEPDVAVSKVKEYLGL